MILAALIFAQLPFFAPLDTSGPVPYFIPPGLRAEDSKLAEWALKAWEKAVGGTLVFRAAEEKEAVLRLRWVSTGEGRYGEMRPILVGSKRGAEVFIQTSTDGLGEQIAEEARRDPLFRDAIVYLTCLHESGHGLGLEHTREYADIMYFFGYGGDVKDYFMRYRRNLKTRDDIKNHSGLSPSDIGRVRRLYPSQGAR